MTHREFLEIIHFKQLQNDPQHGTQGGESGAPKRPARQLTVEETARYFDALYK